MNLAGDIYAQRKRAAAMTPMERALAGMPERLDCGLPNPELVYLRRGNKPRQPAPESIQILSPQPRG